MGRGQEAGPEVFLDLLRRHGDKIYNFAYRLAGNEPDARDLVQESFARAFRRRGDYDPARPFDTWLCRILHNIYLDGVRRYERRHVVSLDAPVGGRESGDWADVLPGPDPDPEQITLRREQDERLRAALKALPVDYRAAVTLCDIERMSYEEISRVMMCPIGTVRSRIHQGRTLLRRYFDRREERREHERS